jgi:hypothetical protein
MPLQACTHLQLELFKIQTVFESNDMTILMKKTQILWPWLALSCSLLTGGTDMHWRQQCAATYSSWVLPRVVLFFAGNCHEYLATNRQESFPCSTRSLARRLPACRATAGRGGARGRQKTIAYLRPIINAILRLYTQINVRCEMTKLPLIFYENDLRVSPTI